MSWEFSKLCSMGGVKLCMYTHTDMQLATAVPSPPLLT
jgi:hypothetical protein